MPIITRKRHIVKCFFRKFFIFFLSFFLLVVSHIMRVLSRCGFPAPPARPCVVCADWVKLENRLSLLADVGVLVKLAQRFKARVCEIAVLAQPRKADGHLVLHAVHLNHSVQQFFSLGVHHGLGSHGVVLLSFDDYIIARVGGFVKPPQQTFFIFFSSPLRGKLRQSQHRQRGQ